MKRLIAIALMFAFAGTLPAAAAGNLAVTEERLIVVPTYEGSFEALLYAVITNTGDEPAMLGECSFSVQDPEGKELYRNDYLAIYPRWLQPGENAAFYESTWGGVADTREGIASHALTLSSTDEDYLVIQRFPATGSYTVTDDGVWTFARVEAEIENNTDKPVYDLVAAYILRDADGKLLCAMSGSAYSVGAPAGGKILIRGEIRSELVDYFESAGIEPASVEVIAFTEGYRN